MVFTWNYFYKKMKKKTKPYKQDVIHIWNLAKKNDRTAKKLLDYYRKKAKPMRS